MVDAASQCQRKSILSLTNLNNEEEGSPVMSPYFFQFDLKVLQSG